MAISSFTLQYSNKDFRFIIKGIVAKIMKRPVTHALCNKTPTS